MSIAICMCNVAAGIVWVSVYLLLFIFFVCFLTACFCRNKDAYILNFWSSTCCWRCSCFAEDRGVAPSDCCL